VVGNFFEFHQRRTAALPVESAQIGVPGIEELHPHQRSKVQNLRHRHSVSTDEAEFDCTDAVTRSKVHIEPGCENATSETGDGNTARALLVAGPTPTIEG
jgi:hypothetical protein